MQDTDNARTEVQVAQMKHLDSLGYCLFCKEGMRLTKKKILFRGDNWFVTPNDFPYSGSKTHVLVVPVRHVITPKKLYTNELIELFSIIIPWLEKELGISGMTALFRFGDTKKTGATIHHLHVHFIEGVEKSSPDHIPITAVVGFKSA